MGAHRQAEHCCCAAYTSTFYAHDPWCACYTGTLHVSQVRQTSMHNAAQRLTYAAGTLNPTSFFHKAFGSLSGKPSRQLMVSSISSRLLGCQLGPAAVPPAAADDASIAACCSCSSSCFHQRNASVPMLPPYESLHRRVVRRPDQVKLASTASTAAVLPLLPCDCSKGIAYRIKKLVPVECKAHRTLLSRLQPAPACLVVRDHLRSAGAAVRSLLCITHRVLVT